MPDIILPNYTAARPSGGDDLAELQGRIDDLHAAGGGTVALQRGTYLLSGPLLLYSDIRLEGRGWTSTFIKAKDDGTFADGEAVVMTEGFTTDADLWDYYTPYPDGLVMASGLAHLSIDGNRANVANANGLMIYGGKHSLDHVGVFGAAGHGIWTECGTTGASNTGDDLHDFLNMHEAVASKVYIASCGKRGWWYRGPNDSAIDQVQIKGCGWSGFYHDAGSGSSAASSLKIGKLHVYSCNTDTGTDPDEFLIKLDDGHQADFVYVDTPTKNGLVVAGARGQISEVRVFKPGTTGTSSSHYAVDLGGEDNSIGTLRSVSDVRTSGSYGGILKVSGTDCHVGDAVVKENASSTVDITPVWVTGSGGHRVKAKVKNSSASTYAALLDVSRCDVDFEANSCGTAGIRYSNSGQSRNKIASVISGSGTGSYSNATTIATTDRIEVTTTSRSRQIIGINDFGRAGSVSVSTGTMTPASSNDAYTGSGATVTSISNTIGQNIVWLLTNNGSGSLVFTHNSSTLRCPGGSDFTLAVNESCLIYLAASVATILR